MRRAWREGCFTGNSKSYVRRVKRLREEDLEGQLLYWGPWETYNGSPWKRSNFIGLHKENLRQLVRKGLIQYLYCTRILSFSRMYSRFVIGLLNGHNTLRIHLYFKGLFNSPLWRRCGAEEKASAHVLCECKDLATLRYTYFGSSFLGSEDVRSMGLGQSRTSVEERSCHDLDIRLGA